MNISIIIPAKNEEKYIRKGLDNIIKAVVLLNEKYPSVKSEIILVNNTSTDKTTEIAKQYVNKIIDTTADSIAGVRNAGAAAAENEIFVFIDADSCMKTDSLLKIHTLFIETNIRAGCCLILPDKKINFIYSFIIWLANFIFYILNTGGGMYFCLKNDFKNIGGFDERLYAAEDLDFAKRIKKYVIANGYKFKNCRNIIITTSMRKIKFFGWRRAVTLFLRLVIQPNKLLRARKNWERLFYNTEKLR